jgi:hypothetical protein
LFAIGGDVSMKYIVMCYMMSMYSLVLAGEGIEQFSEGGIEQEWEGDIEGGESDFDSKKNSSALVFKCAVERVCRPKINDEDRKSWALVIGNTLNEHHELLESPLANVEDFQSPLLFALRKRNFSLLQAFALAEKHFFNDDENSLTRRKEALSEAVETYYVDGVKALLPYTPLTPTTGYDLLDQLVFGCMKNQIDNPACFTCCFKKKIDPQREQWSHAIAQLLIKHGTPVKHLRKKLDSYNCRGVGCSYIRSEANKPIETS